MIKNAKQSSKIPNEGSFSLDGPELKWISCREDFSKVLDENQKGFFFSHKIGCEINISNFIDKTETILIDAALQNFNKSEFKKTNYNFATWVEPARFWMDCSLRKSLFTMLLRCGINYTGDYESALYSIEYSKITKKAIQRFLYGFTEFNHNGEEFTGIGKGWVSYFANKSCNLVYEKLKMPKHVEHHKFSFGEDILWV